MGKEAGGAEDEPMICYTWLDYAALAFLTYCLWQAAMCMIREAWAALRVAWYVDRRGSVSVRARRVIARDRAERNPL